MSERLRHPWPRFALVTLTAGSLPRDFAVACPALTVPSSGIGAFEPVPELTLISTPGGQELICFGASARQVMCLNPANGQVVDMVTGPHGNAVQAPVMVNSTLDQFAATVRAATARFPFHGDDSDFQAAADRLRADLQPIDPPAWQHDGLWDTFYWDVTIGDYSPVLFEPPDH